MKLYSSGNSVSDNDREYWEREAEYCKDPHYFFIKYWTPKNALMPLFKTHLFAGNDVRLHTAPLEEVFTSSGLGRRYIREVFGYKT